MVAVDVEGCHIQAGGARLYVPTVVFLVSQPILTIFTFALSETLEIPLLLFVCWCTVCCIGAARAVPSPSGREPSRTDAPLDAQAEPRYGSVEALLTGSGGPGRRFREVQGGARKARRWSRAKVKGETSIQTRRNRYGRQGKKG